jgi:hypothetical protein
MRGYTQETIGITATRNQQLIQATRDASARVKTQ